jgi:hypothetical protein
MPPTPAPTSPPATPAPTLIAGQDIPPLPDAPLDPGAQAAALLPEFKGDIDRAGEWNRYTISAAIDPATGTIAGHERLEYTNRDTGPLDQLYFHLLPNLSIFGGELVVRALAIDGQPADVVYARKRYLLSVKLPQPLAPGATTLVTLDFKTTAPDSIGADLNGAFNKEQGMLALASSYPIVAIVRRGAWDTGVPDPKGDYVNSETALYDVTLAAPADWTLATTGVVVEQRQDGEQQIARIVSGPQRDFAIAALQYKQASTDVDGTRLISHYRPQHEAGGQATLQAAAGALRTFNARYGRYPLAELDIVEVDATTFTGVEYPGLIMIRQDLYLDGGSDLETTVAHEVAHQWWYSIVGNDQLNESWLDEALASYSEIVYQEAIHGPDAAAAQLEGFRARYRTAVTSGRDAPVARPNQAFHNNYVLLVYGKAVLFVQALRNQIGAEAFDRFLQAHYAQHRYAYIGGADLLADAEGACGCDLHQLYEDWIVKVAPVEVP